jgi:hypothetical protein
MGDIFPIRAIYARGLGPAVSSSPLVAVRRTRISSAVLASLWAGSTSTLVGGAGGYSHAFLSMYAVPGIPNNPLSADISTPY